MKPYVLALTAALCFLTVPSAHAIPFRWVEGQHYFSVKAPNNQPLPRGTAEVTEVFSYGCPACFQFNPIAQRLKDSLPSEAKLTYLPASFIAAENWPVFQRAYLTAEALGVAEQAHDQFFDAVWKDGGELAVRDSETRKAKKPLPSIEAVAKFYHRVTGVSVEKFVSTAQSPGIDAKMKAADAQVIVYEADRTPTLIVNRKYRVHVHSAGSYDELIQVVNWLIQKDAAPARAPALTAN
jgi:protein dithiol oxidoreductase (disulfide-forming)